MKVLLQTQHLMKLIKIIVLILIIRNNELSATEYYNLIYTYKTTV